MFSFDRHVVDTCIHVVLALQDGFLSSRLVLCTTQKGKQTSVPAAPFRVSQATDAYTECS